MIRIFIFSITLLLIGSPNNKKSSINIETQEPILRFGLLSDVQYCDCESTEVRFFSNSLDKLGNAIDDFNTEALSFVISLGDLIDRDFDSYSSVLPIFDSSKAKVYHVLGNHDFEMDHKDRKKVSSELNTGPGYYSFDIENFRFIVVNSNDISTYSIKSKNRKDATRLIDLIVGQGGKYGAEWNGGLSMKQLAWLDKELTGAKESGKKVIIFSHHPLWPEGRHNILNFKEITDMLLNYDHVIGWFCGHNHSGGYGNLNLIHCVNFKGMVDTPDTNAYSVVEIYENKIWIKGRGRERSQILAY